MMEDPAKRDARTAQHLRDTKANAAATKAEWDTPLRPAHHYAQPATNTTAVARVKRPATSGVYKWQGGQEQANSVEGVLAALDTMEQRKAKQ